MTRKVLAQSELQVTSINFCGHLPGCSLELPDREIAPTQSELSQLSTFKHQMICEFELLLAESAHFSFPDSSSARFDWITHHEHNWRRSGTFKVLVWTKRTASIFVQKTNEKGERSSWLPNISPGSKLTQLVSMQHREACVVLVFFWLAAWCNLNVQITSVELVQLI